MKLAKQAQTLERVEPDMTPMIDCCFQLIIFFMLTLKVLQPEGDFGIRMPLSAPSAGEPDPDALPPMKVRLSANSDGSLNAIRLNALNLGKKFEALRREVRAIVPDSAGPNSSAEVELDCDFHLHYACVVEAITAVSGYVKDGQIHHLVEKIKFSPPRKGA